MNETGDTTKTVIASTASPFKFNQAVLSALGENIDGIGDFELIDRLSQKSGMELSASLAELKNKEKRFEGMIAKTEMPELVSQVLKVK